MAIDDVMPDQEHTIELILRFKTNMDRGELDDFLSGASETLFADYRDEDSEDLLLYTIYEPGGSHWRDIGIDPSAAVLAGGNRLGPGREETPVS